MSIRTTNESTTGSPRKLALVIGNSKYEDGQNLPNAVNDAIKMASALKTIGFDIVANEAQLNLTYEDMLHALVRFKCLIKAGDTIVFYYSGHGKEYNHQNYLIPVDNITKDGQNRAQISGDDLRASAMNVQDTLAELTDRKPFVIIFFLDCCRLYRLRNENIINRPKGGSMNQSQTFRSLTATAGSLIAFACGPGSMADDGKKGETNGLFTKHLLKHIINPNEDVLSILACVIRDVQEESNGQQIPNYTGALTQRFVYLCETVPQTSTSGSLARSTRISSSNYLNQNVNILLIAEKGVGKSTFINALVNYLSFGTVEQAQMHDPIVLKPLSFFMATNEPYQEHIVTFGNFVQQNSSVTQRCETYKFDLAQNNGKKLCLIDTPSLDDATSNENIRHMIDYVTKLTHLNAICFLLQPDASQLMTSFQSCFGQLMNHLGQHAQQNIIFCFTNALMGISVPGKTASLLRNMFRSHSMNDIPFSKDNTFIFENESFRYLMAIENGIRFNNEDIAEYTMSWPDSVNEAKRLLDYLLRRPLFYIRK